MPRTLTDLREALFDTLADLRAGKIDEADAKQAVNLGKALIDSGRLELEAVANLGVPQAATGFLGMGPQQIEGPKS